MTTPLYCLLFFAAWTLLPVLVGIGPVRVLAVLRGRAASNSFPADQPHGSPAYRRLMRAHANCVENLPVFGAVVLIGAVVGLSSEAFDRLAVIYVAARIGQSIVHASSGSELAVNVRFTFFLVQLGAVIWMGVLLIGA